MKASKHRGSGGSASSSCFRQQLPSERLTVSGAQLIQQHASNCYSSSSFNTPPLNPASTHPACLFLSLTRKTRGGTSTGSEDQRLFLCHSLAFFSPPTRERVNVDMKIRVGKYFYFVFLMSGFERQRGETGSSKRWMQWRGHAQGDAG